MLETIAERLAVKIHSMSPHQTSTAPVLKYGLELILNYVVIMLLSLGSAYFLGTVIETILVMLFFRILRKIHGGFHFSTSEMCILSSSAAIVAVPLIHVTDQGVLIISLIILPIVLWYTESMRNRLISAVLISINCFLLSDIMVCTYALQSILLLIPYRKEV